MVAEQLASAGKLSMLVSAPLPPLTMTPGKQTTIKDYQWRISKNILLLVEFQIDLTNCAIFSLAVGGFDKMREVDCRDEKSQPSHLQRADLTQTLSIEEHYRYCK